MTKIQQVNIPGPPLYTTSSPIECRKYIRDTTGTHRFALGRRSKFLDFAHHVFDLHRISINFVNLNSTQGFTVTKAGPAQYYSFQFLLRGTCRLEGGFGHAVANPGDLFILDPEGLTTESWPGDCVQLLVRVDKELLNQTASRELNRTLRSGISFTPVSRDPGIRLWLEKLTELLQHEDFDAEHLDNWRVQRDFERTLVTMLLSGLDHSESNELRRNTPVIAPYYVKRAEVWIREHYLEEITVDDIVSSAGVCARTLFYGFKRWRSTTPMAYVRDLRLEHARAEIKELRSRGGTVSEAAMNSGITNLSQFSRIYKARFGESPSATLRKG